MNEDNKINVMKKWMRNTLPNSWKDNMIPVLWYNIILFVYFKKDNCNNIIIQQKPNQTDHAHLPTPVSIPWNHSLCHLLLLGDLLKQWFFSFFGLQFGKCRISPTVFHFMRWLVASICFGVDELEDGQGLS